MSQVVGVRRTGGFAGMTRTGEVDLASPDPRAEELTVLVERVDAGELRAAGAGAARPDGFVYDFDLCGEACRVHEQALTAELRRIAELVLE